MRHSPVVVARSQVIDASPERVWSLLSSPEAWSLRPAMFAFDVTAPPGQRLRITLGLGRAGPICMLYEISEEVPGQAISLHTPTMPPLGRQRLSLSAEPQGHGTRATITISSPVPRRGSKGDIEAYWQVQLETWLGHLSAVIEGRSSWPDAGMGPGLRAACSPPAPLASPAEVSASALIRGPIGQVWRTVHAPESALLGDPTHVVCAGRVPGTPAGQVGEIQYFVRRQDDGQLATSACVVTELTDQHSALTATIAPRHTEMLHLVTPDSQGTQLQLTARWPAASWPVGKKNQALKRQMADWVQAAVDGYKKLIENAEDGGQADQPVG
jgi:Polyketide cyclase / dehydrase and lipid transport